MKTDQLISLLASGVAPVPRGAATRRIALALVIGVPFSVAIMVPLSVAIMGYDWGVRRDLALVMLWPMFWFKLLFPVAIATGAFVAVQRLSRPGVPAARAWIALALPVLAVWALGLAVWFMAPEAERMPLLWGQTWRSCAFSIAIISAPVLVALLVALKGLAPPPPRTGRCLCRCAGRGRRCGRVCTAMPRTRRAVSGSVVHGWDRVAGAGRRVAGAAASSLVKTAAAPAEWA